MEDKELLKESLGVFKKKMLTITPEEILKINKLLVMDYLKQIKNEENKIQ